MSSSTHTPGPKSPRRTRAVLVLADTPAAHEAGFHFHRWGDAAAPSFLDQDVIVALVPPDGPMDDEVVRELGLARRAGVAMLLLVSEASSLKTTQRLCGCKVTRVARGIGLGRIVISDERFHDQLSRQRHVFFAFTPTPALKSAASLGAADTAIALTGSEPESAFAVLPCSEPLEASAARRLVDVLLLPMRPAADERRMLAATTRVTVTLVVALLAMTLLRYTQRTANTSSLSPDYHNNLRVRSSECPLVDAVGSRGLVALPTILPGAMPSTGSASELRTSMLLARNFGMVGLERRLVNTALSSPGDPEAESFLMWYARSLFGEIEEDLQRQRYEAARFAAQRYLNILSALPPSAQHDEAVRQIDYARRACYLVERHFLYPDSALVHGLIVMMRGDGDAELAGALAKTVPFDTTLREEVAYANEAMSDHSNPYEVMDLRWQDLRSRVANPHLAEAASFNAGRAAVARLEGAAGEEKQRAAAFAAERFQQFIETYPRSPLADDAALFMVRLEVARDRPKLALAWFGRMLAHYGGCDATKRLEYVLRSAVTRSMLGPNATEQVARFVCLAARDEAVDASVPWPADADELRNVVVRMGVETTRGATHESAGKVAENVLAWVVRTRWPEAEDGQRD